MRGIYLGLDLTVLDASELGCARTKADRECPGRRYEALDGVPAASSQARPNLLAPTPRPPPRPPTTLKISKNTRFSLYKGRENSLRGLPSTDGEDIVSGAIVVDFGVGLQAQSIKVVEENR